MYRILTPLVKLMLLLWTVTLVSCQHEPFMAEPSPNPPPPPIDTTGQGSGNPVDTTGVPCDDNIIYFERDVLPILVSNCAITGCHSPASAQDGVILNSYESVLNTTDVVPFDLDDSEIIEVLYETDPDKVMPPPTQTPLQQEQIDLIEQWVLQGAENLTCDENSLGCETNMVSFSATIFPLIQNQCLGCHSGNNPGGGYDFSTHAGVESAVLNNRLVGAVSHDQGFSPMPQNGAMLSPCEISKIEAWVNDGAPNN